ncbi:uncharacterized protein LOC106709956 [Papilio machaon]|nr:uncharacterized protein LOC106709956 [Papilio machaon]
MSVVRTCMYLLVLSVNFHYAVGKPLFGGLFWCEMFCDDDYDDVSTSTTSTSTEDMFDFFDACSGCPTSRPSTRRPLNNFPPLNFEIPPNTGMGVTVSNRNGSWFMNLNPWTSRNTTPLPAAATRAAPTTAGAGGTTTVATTTAKK